MRRILPAVVVAGLIGALLGVVGVRGFHARSSAGPLPSPSVLASVADGRTPIARENAKPGSTGWRLHGVRSPHRIEGYASRTSVAAGEPLDVFVRTRAERFTADVYRMGYYSGMGGRRVTSVGPLAGDAQRTCPVSSDRLRTVACDWRRSFTVSTDASWVSGVYLIKLSATDETQSWVPFVVREAHPQAKIVFQTSVTTWQAYNSWGGRSLYGGPCDHRRTTPSPAGDSDEPQQPQPPQRSSSQRPVADVTVLPSATPTALPSTGPEPTTSSSPSPGTSASPTAKKPTYDCGYYSRSRAVSFDRPYQYPGDGQFFRFEYPMLNWLESMGLWVAYTTDVDLHQGTTAMDHRVVFLSVGHDEYYSTAMRRSLESALARGTSLAFFGGNDMYRHIRFEPSPLGPDRIEVNYKAAAEDPSLRSDRSETTTQWREWPLHEPEQALLGAQYECNPVRASWVATGEPAWLFQGTGFSPGDEIPNLVGYEYDRVMPGYRAPPGITLIAKSPVRCGGRNTESDSTFYVAPSGAGVFDAGTLWFTCPLGPDGCNNAQDPHPVVDVRLRALVRNLIFAMVEKRFG